LAFLTDPKAFFPWIKGIALNHCRNEWRRQHRQALQPFEKSNGK
jgi:DNA-directed RNA polymerase specialized sigma24 family protein